MSEGHSAAGSTAKKFISLIKKKDYGRRTAHGSGPGKDCGTLS